MIAGTGFNHHPAQQGIWFEYNGWRFKDVYHIKLYSGEVLKFMYPNGNGWHPDMGAPKGQLAGRDIKDNDVMEVMLVPDAEIEAVGSFRFTGAHRVKYNIDLFDDCDMPPVPPAEAYSDKTTTLAGA
ncbi:MAG: hypothetical protein ACRCZA_05695 [Shewanella sp.]|uniref:hypothetical protein n=1 Tax=Shewanella sp. TaxID=50422 RepID=UPI003F2F5588